MTLAVSRAVAHFSWRHTGAIDRHVRYVSTCVEARVVGGGRETMNKRYRLWRRLFTCIGCTLLTCDMYMSDLRHIHDPVLSSLKMEGIRIFYFLWNLHKMKLRVHYLIKYIFPNKVILYRSLCFKIELVKTVTFLIEWYLWSLVFFLCNKRKIWHTLRTCICGGI
jgi:hypothetical protein